ncbi:helix-turn-helix domain-containing protein [Chryseobacterium sp. A301]
MTKSPKSWTLVHLRNYHRDKVQIDTSKFTIIYTAKDDVTLHIGDSKIKIASENFFFLPPNVDFYFEKKYRTAFVFAFDQDFFISRLELLYQIKNGNLFSNPKGTLVKNDFFPYELILEHYYLPVRRPGANQIIRKNSLLNFLEFILIRILLSSDSEMKIHSQQTYEKEITDRFLFILAHEETINLNATYYSEQLNITKRTLDNAIKDTYGCTAKKYLIGKATERSKTLLITTDKPIKQISAEVGFSQESNFVNFFKKNTGLTPGQFRTTLTSEQPALNFMSPKLTKTKKTQ